MFTGIVVDPGRVRKARSRVGVLELEIEASRITRDLAVGDSVAVSGVCLTATSVARRRFTTQAMEETTARSNLGGLRRGDAVNLELPVRLSDRLGGHIVQGHVDGVAKAVRIQDLDGMRRVWLEASDDILRYLVGKGSVALDGVSLTVVEVGRTSFQVALIPHTLQHTTLGSIERDSTVNVEVDLIAKYVERFVEPHEARGRDRA